MPRTSQPIPTAPTCRAVASFVDGYLRARAQGSTAQVTPTAWGLTVRYGAGMGRTAEHFVTQAFAGPTGAQLASDHWLTIFDDIPMPSIGCGWVARPRAREFFMAADLAALARASDSVPPASGDAQAPPGAVVLRHDIGGVMTSSLRCALAHDEDIVIDSVATDPAWRGRGLAAGLVRAAAGWGLACGRRRMLLIASPQGHGLYSRLGFRTIAPVHVFVVERQAVPTG